MTLSEWRNGLGISVRKAALLITETAGESISSQHLGSLERGVWSPTIDTVDIIHRGTGGAVTDWPVNGGVLVLSRHDGPAEEKPNEAA